MPDEKNARKTNTRGISTDNKANTENELPTSETDSEWKTPSKLKQEVQTIIDIMGPQLSPNFNYNTSSEADNEESVFSSSKYSSEKSKKLSNKSKEESEKNDTRASEPTSKDEAPMSTAADVNTTSMSATLDDLTDPKVNFPYVENFCRTNQYICPPPLLPAGVCINSDCFCPQLASMLQAGGMHPSYGANNNYYKREVPQPRLGDIECNNIGNNGYKANKETKNAVINWLKTIVSSSKSLEKKSSNICNSEYYKMNVKRKRGDDNSPPRRVVFELVQSLSKNTESENVISGDQIDGDAIKHNKNAKNERLQTRADLQCFCTKDSPPDSRRSRKPVEKITYSDSQEKTRVDVYYFDHGSFNHYQTTDEPPIVLTEQVADTTEKHTTRFWAEIFGTVHIGISFVTSLILQCFRFLLYSVCRPLTIGLIQLASDYFFKPLLVTLFNGVIQPILIFVYNIIGSIRDICDPIAEGIGYFLRELATLVRAFRLIEVTNENCKCQTECKCDKKVKKSKTAC